MTGLPVGELNFLKLIDRSRSPQKTGNGEYGLRGAMRGGPRSEARSYATGPLHSNNKNKALAEDETGHRASVEFVEILFLAF
jgi:hypothetical protein